MCDLYQCLENNSFCVFFFCLNLLPIYMYSFNASGIFSIYMFDFLLIFENYVGSGKQCLVCYLIKFPSNLSGKRCKYLIENKIYKTTMVRIKHNTNVFILIYSIKSDFISRLDINCKRRSWYRCSLEKLFLSHFYKVAMIINFNLSIRKIFRCCCNILITHTVNIMKNITILVIKITFPD